MTTARTPQSPARFRLPDPPRREPDEMTSYDHLHKPGSPHYLAWHFGRPDTTLVEAERWISAQPDADRSSGRRPDLLIAFDVNPAAYQASNGYIISEQGKPPGLRHGNRLGDHRRNRRWRKARRVRCPGALRNTGASTSRASITAPDWPETA